ncbi:hypothetical protein [Mesobacillus jeotgali]|uniref:hypothetical protein n=1 Tax=Mesobacillus jeotgali TaxID=129985 RepID=UPI000C826484|nr:hypothetical protein [Mesobacillus jeotgali]
MKLLEATYEKSNVEDLVQSLGLGVDGNVLLPWVSGEYMLQNKDGNVVGFIFENTEGGLTVTDSSTNVIGFSQMNDSELFTIHDTVNNETYRVFENSFQGSNVFDQGMNLSFLSDENVFGGANFYSNNMELIGSTQNELGIVFQSTGASSNIDSFLTQQKVDFADLSSFDFYDSASLFDILDFL